LASGRAHLARQDGDEPRSPEAWGWRSVTVGAGQYERAEWRPSGERVGWVDNDGHHLYLEPDAAYTVAQRLARDGGDTLPVTPQILWKRLKERRLLASVDEKRQTLKIRRTFQRQQHDVLHLHASALLPPTAPDKPDNEPDSGSFEGSEGASMSGSMSDRVSGFGPHPTPNAGEPLREAVPDVGFVGSSGGDRQPSSETRTSDGEPMSGPVSGGPNYPTPDPTKPDTGAGRRSVWRCACTAFERHRRLDGGWVCSGCGPEAPAPEVAA